MYWIYDISQPLLGLLFFVVFVGFAAAGLLLFRGPLRRAFAEDEGWRENVVITLEGAFVFFGLLLALVTIAAYDNYATAREKVAAEASELGSLYRDISGYPEPLRGELQTGLKDYAKYVIEEAWPQQRRGITPEAAGTITTAFQDRLEAFNPSTNGEVALHSATLAEFNDFVKARRERLHFVTVGPPAVLWAVLVMGAVLTIMITWLLPVQRLKGHLVLSGASAIVVALLLFVAVSLDNPFRGDLSVSPHAYELIQHDIMGVAVGAH